MVDSTAARVRVGRPATEARLAAVNLRQAALATPVAIDTTVVVL